MRSKVLQIVMLFGLLISTLASAESRFPTQEPMGGEPFGHSVKKISDGVYVFRWWVYRNIFVVTDDGVIVTDPMNPKAAELLRSEISKVTESPSSMSSIVTTITTIFPAAISSKKKALNLWPTKTS